MWRRVPQPHGVADYDCPEVAQPRGDLGRIRDSTTPCFGWCPPMCRLRPVIRETDGKVNRVYSWHGPSRSGRPASDFRCRLSCLSYHALLRNEAARGNYPTCVPETHYGLMGVELPVAAQESLRALDQDAHNAFDIGAGDYNIDEYCAIFDELPGGYSSPAAFLVDYLRTPNEMAASEFRPTRPHKHFDAFSKFELKIAGTHADITDPSVMPKVGDWYHIFIPANNGDVIITDVHMGDARWCATVQTMTDQEVPGISDNHPVSGRRQFGLERLAGGAYRFYSRGFDRQSSRLMDLQVSNIAQHQTFTNLMSAMAKRHGGRPERLTDKGGKIWGWVRQIPADVMVSSICVKTRTGPFCWPFVPCCCTGLALWLRDKARQWRRRLLPHGVDS